VTNPNDLIRKARRFTLEGREMKTIAIPTTEHALVFMLDSLDRRHDYDAAVMIHELVLEGHELAGALEQAERERDQLRARLATLEEEQRKDYADVRRFQGMVIKLTHEGNDLRAQVAAMREAVAELWDEVASDDVDWDRVYGEIEPKVKAALALLPDPSGGKEPA
jgi:predicted nuclease with TOPRIM domain